MRYPEITSIELLEQFMWGEAITWRRTDYDNATVNKAGIAQQWASRVDREHKDMPVMILATIYQPERKVGDEILKANFEMVSFWFDDNGNRVERPKKQLDAAEA